MEGALHLRDERQAPQEHDCGWRVFRGHEENHGQVMERRTGTKYEKKKDLAREEGQALGDMT